MLTSSSKPWGDVGDNLTNFFKELEQKREKQRLEAQVRVLKQSLKDLKLKEQRLVEQLNDEKSLPEKRTKISENHELAEAVDFRQKMDLYKICFGVTGIKHEPVTGKLVVRFHPVSNGQTFGPFQVKFTSCHIKPSPDLWQIYLKVLRGNLDFHKIYKLKKLCSNA